MALERIVSNKHFSGNYTDEEILNLFSNEDDIKYGEVIIFNDKVNPTLYFLDENGELASIQKLGIEDGSDLDVLMDEVRQLAEDVEGLHTTVIDNKEELENDLAGLTLRLEILEEKEGGDVSPEIMEKIETNSANIEELNTHLISVENKLFNLEDEVEENELVHSAGINLLNDLIKKLEQRISSIEGGGVDIDLTEINEKLEIIEENITNINTEVETLDNNFGGLDSRITKIEEDIENGNFNVDLTEVENKLNGLEDNISDISTNIESINETLGGVEERLSNIEETGIEIINTKINALEKKDIEILNSIQSLKINEIDSLNTKVKSLNAKDEDLEERIENLEKLDLTPITDRINSLEENNIIVDEHLTQLNEKTSELEGILGVLKEEVEENELVHSAGLITLNKGLNDLKEAVKNIEGGEISVDLTEIENRLDTAETNILNLNDRVKSIEDGEVEVDFTEIENRISEVETISNTNKSNIDVINENVELINGDIEILKNNDLDFESRIGVLENIEPVDLTEIEGKVSTLETTVSTVSKTANNALTTANESIKTIDGEGDDYITVSTSKTNRNVDINIKTNVVLYKDASETINGLASTLDIKNEINEIKSIIDAYTINGKIISENPELTTNNLNVGDDYLTFIPEDTQSILPSDNLTLALAKIEKKMDIALEVITAALNDLNNRIGLLENNE